MVQGEHTTVDLCRLRAAEATMLGRHAVMMIHPQKQKWHNTSTFFVLIHSHTHNMIKHDRQSGEVV
jgi:hypothetical protein